MLFQQKRNNFIFVLIKYSSEKSTKLQNGRVLYFSQRFLEWIIM